MIEKVSINGVLSRPEDAKISVFDRGFLYGDAIYEVTRSYGKILFFLEEHLDRLARSAEKVGISLGRTRAEWVAEVYRLHNACEGEDAYVRIQVTRGEGPIGLDPALAPRINEIVYVRPVPIYSPEFYSRGCAILTTPVLRNSRAALDPNIKSGNYLNNILAMRYGSGKGVQECLMRNARGNITEATTSNVWIVKDGVVKTPSDKHDLLFGITRDKVRSICRDHGIPLEEGEISMDDLFSADEIFLTSSVREIMPVASVDGRAVPQAPGPLTQKLHRAYQDLIGAYIRWARDHHPWQTR